jgi:hypothetical protein
MSIVNKVLLVVTDAQSKLSHNCHVVIAANPTTVNQSDVINCFTPVDLVNGDAQ